MVLVGGSDILKQGGEGFSLAIRSYTNLVIDQHVTSHFLTAWCSVMLFELCPLSDKSCQMSSLIHFSSLLLFVFIRCLFMIWTAYLWCWQLKAWRYLAGLLNVCVYVKRGCWQWFICESIFSCMAWVYSGLRVCMLQNVLNV